MQYMRFFVSLSLALFLFGCGGGGGGSSSLAPAGGGDSGGGSSGSGVGSVSETLDFSVASTDILITRPSNGEVVGVALDEVSQSGNLTTAN